MTWVTDNTGTRWIEPPERKRRAKATKGRFSDIAVGDQLEERHWSRERLRQQLKRDAPPTFYIVTDLWFDPVRGQANEWSGQMVGYQRLGSNGEPIGKKLGNSRHGLASLGFHKAEIDYVGQRRATVAAVADVNVVGIGFGRVIRRRPKLSGGL